MFPDSDSSVAIKTLVALALEEDLGPRGWEGDLTSSWFLPEGATSTACITAREPLVLAGVDAAIAAFHTVDSSLAISCLPSDGAKLSPGEVAMEITGPTRALLAAERTALNFLQHLSGVATLTRQFVDLVAGTPARILDTRKTLPGWRTLQKAAVRAGGGQNHRSNLHEMIMVKDNHLAALGADPRNLVTGRGILNDHMERFRRSHPSIGAEVEADTVEQALAWFTIPGVQVVLLDNMTLEELRICVKARPEGIKLEASGGITLETARDIAATGVDFLSIGALTHSVRAVDLGLDFPAL
jgi:nicotinate-nucleotide pyrophosphorylase (carboxylating)